MQHKHKIIEQITRKTFLGFTIQYVLIQHGVVCPVCAYTPLYASVRPCTPQYALVRPCLRLSALFSHTPVHRRLESESYMENPMYILNIHMGQTDRHFKNTQHLSDHLV